MTGPSRMADLNSLDSSAQPAVGLTQSPAGSPQPPLVRVLIVDDSSFMRKALAYILKSDCAIDIAGTAADGKEAIRQVRDLEPDVVLLDIQMPGMDGLATLECIMARHPTPVLVLTGLYAKDPAVVLKSLECGAVDFIAKPSGVISYNIERIRDEIICKVKAAATANVREPAQRPFSGPLQSCRPETPGGGRIVVIGASTGGPRAVADILAGLPCDITSAVLIVQHLSRNFVPCFADRLKWGCSLDVSVAQKGQPLLPGHVLVAPGDCQTAMVQDGNLVRVRLNRGPSSCGIVPSIDHAMTSASQVYGSRTVGVLLTGMGRDGALGMKAIKEAGGCTIAEAPSTCLIFGMPKAAIEMGCVDEIVPLDRIPQAILKMLSSRDS